MVAAPTIERLRSGGDILAVLRGPDQRAGRLAVVHVARGRPDGPPRIAVVASRRVGGAVNRNRVKRLLREAARRVDWRPGTDVVLVGRAAGAAAGLSDVLDEMRHLARQLGALEEAA